MSLIQSLTSDSDNFQVKEHNLTITRPGKGNSWVIYDHTAQAYYLCNDVEAPESRMCFDTVAKAVAFLVEHFNLKK